MLWFSAIAGRIYFQLPTLWFFHIGCFLIPHRKCLCSFLPPLRVISCLTSISFLPSRSEAFGFCHDCFFRRCRRKYLFFFRLENRPTSDLLIATRCITQAEGFTIFSSAVADGFKLSFPDSKTFRRFPLWFFYCHACLCGWVCALAIRRCGRSSAWSPDAELVPVRSVKFSRV